VGLTQKLIKTSKDIYTSRVAAPQRAIARRCLVDSIGPAFAAIGGQSIEILLAGAPAAAGAREGTVIAYGRPLRAEEAALINGTMISLQLYDDNNEQMRGHPSGPLWPAVLAAAEMQNKSLTEAYTAFVVGYEVECQLGTVLNPSHYEIGWHATATQGVIAATIAAALLLGLNDEQTARALGLAASFTSGLRRNFGTMTMSFHSGIAASNGVRAARLAQQGFSADPEIFDGAMSFGDVFSREWSPAAFDANLDVWGKPFAINAPGPVFKLFPCGRPTLLGVDCAMALQAKHNIDVTTIRRITCDVSYMYPRTLIHARPQTGLQGKTSIQYCVASALLDRRPTLASFTDEAVRRPAITALIDKTEVRVPPELGEDVPAVRKAPFEQPLKVTVETNDGRVFSETVQFPKGSPQNPISEAEHEGKLEDCVIPHLGRERCAELLAYLKDDKATVRGLLDRLIIKPAV